MRGLKVPSVGLSDLVRDVLRRHSKMAVVSNYWDLSSMSQDAVSDEARLPSRDLPWWPLLAVALLIFCTREPL